MLMHFGRPHRAEQPRHEFGSSDFLAVAQRFDAIRQPWPVARQLCASGESLTSVVAGTTAGNGAAALAAVSGWLPAI